MQKSSFFISFEGIEACGKSTQIQLFEKNLSSQGFKVHIFREPGGCDFSESLRDAILSSQTKINPLAEALLFASARAQLIHEKILKFLETPQSIVIADRFIDSSLVYQGVANNLGKQFILDLHSHPPLEIRPDLTFYLHVPLDIAFERLAKRNQEKDYFESQKKSFHQKIYQGY